MIVPYFDYDDDDDYGDDDGDGDGDIIYHAAPLNKLEKIQKIQNRCLRTCTGQIVTPTAELHDKHIVGKLKARRRAHLNNFMFKQQSNAGLVGRSLPTRTHGATVLKYAYRSATNIKETPSIEVQYHGINFLLVRETYPCIPNINIFRRKRC